MAEQIPQVTPLSEEAARNIPGIASVVPIHQRSRALDLKTGGKPPFRTPVYHRRYLQRGISSGMSIPTKALPVVTVPLPVRSTLAQRIAVYRVQLSRYVSWIKPFGMAPGYPTAHVLSLINTSPRNRGLTPMPHPSSVKSGSVPTARGSGARPTGDGSYYMGSPRRFKKALPVALVAYTPQVYGQ